jgi:hypothetical protein
MTRRLFDYDPITGVKQWFHMADDEKSFTIQTEQPVDALIDANRAQFNSFSSGRDKWGDQIGASTKVASIPLNVYQDLKSKGILKDQAALKRWLNDPDNAVFRTRPGNV